MARLRLARTSWFVAAGAIAAAGATFAWGYARAREPSRICAPGMVPLGARCCGEGQTLDGDHCRGRPSRCAEGLEATDGGCVAPRRTVSIASAALVSDPEDWDTAGARKENAVVEAFRIDAFEVTEAAWSACVDGGKCPRLELRGEPGLPVTGMTATEAEAFCEAAGGKLPSPRQFELAAGGPKGERFPWGGAGAVCLRGAWGLVHGPCAEGGSSPDVTGAHPAGASPEGAQDLAGNVAEWTAPRPDGSSEVRGGSFRDQAAASLKTWQPRLVPADHRLDDVGFRCVYPL